MKNKIPKSIKKHLRLKKSILKKEFSDNKKIKEEINNLYKKLTK
jgi:hypothetical protein